MFIKMSDGTYIPMIESGDNNVYDVDRNRRSREWCSCRWLHESEEQRKLYSLTEKDILATAQREVDKTIERYVGTKEPFTEAEITKENVLMNLGYFNCIQISGHSVTSASRFLNFIKSGIRNAVAMDNLRSGLRFSWYETSEDGQSSKYCSDYAKNENELAEKWKEFQSRGITPWIGLSEAAGEYSWLEMKSRTRKPRAERKKPSEFFIIAFRYAGCDRFMVKLTSRNIKFNSWREYAHKYSSRKLAENALENISRRFNQLSDIRVECVPA